MDLVQAVLAGDTGFDGWHILFLSAFAAFPGLCINAGDTFRSEMWGFADLSNADFELGSSRDQLQVYDCQLPRSVCLGRP